MLQSTCLRTLLLIGNAGGDVNILDDDNETPLFVVESIEVAKWLVDHGADIKRRNNEHLTVSSLSSLIKLLLTARIRQQHL